MSDRKRPAPEIPGFSVLEGAGRGGMGAVFIAEQHSPRRTVALKVLSRAPDADTLAQFRREAEVIATLEHPRIVPLYSYGEHQGAPYLAMRYIKGGSLADRIRRGPMDLPSISRWLAAIAEALDFSHQRGLVHRDVKPSNILLDESGNAYLSDFGIAGTLADAQAELPMGSAAYMSPEQGKGERIDHRADIYALTITLFEALTGQKPYTAETGLGVIVRHIHDPIPAARKLHSAVPPAVDELLQWGMAKDRAQRPQSAGELSRLFDQAVRNPHMPLRSQAAAVDAGKATALPGGVQRGRRGIGTWLAIGIGVIALGGIALVAGGGLVAALIPRADTPRPTATIPTSSPAGSIDLHTPSDAEEGNPSPAIGEQLLFDDFSTPGSGFAVLSDADGGVAYAEGSLRFSVLSEGVRWYSPSGRIEAQDLVVEAIAGSIAGPMMSEIAVLCRWRDLENHTALALRGDQSVGIWQLRGGETTWLLEWTPAQNLDLTSHGPLRLRATCQEAELHLEIDGTVVAQAQDPNPISGDIALMAGLGEPGELVVLFDEVVVSR